MKVASALEGLRENEITNLNALNKQYQTLREHRMKGHQVRSRAELTANCEKPSRFFLNLNKNITELLDSNDVKITDAEQILKMQTNFYQELFSSKTP